jgi:hypothetical protein
MQVQYLEQEGVDKIYNSSKKRYGSPRITIELRQQGMRVSRP